MLINLANWVNVKSTHLHKTVFHLHLILQSLLEYGIGMQVEFVDLEYENLVLNLIVHVVIEGLILRHRPKTSHLNAFILLLKN